jgi:Protein of unknown function (DUF1761)
MNVDINELAVVLATVASMVIGMVWYSPKVFGNAWMKMANIKMGSGSMAWSMGSAVLSSLVMAYVLAHVTFLSHAFFKNSFMQDALTTAFWMWLGFQGLRFFMHDQFNQRRKKESLIHMGNDLVTILAMGAVIGAMGIK